MRIRHDWHRSKEPETAVKWRAEGKGGAAGAKPEP